MDVGTSVNRQYFFIGVRVMNTMAEVSVDRDTCGPCHPDANCINSSAGQKGNVVATRDVKKYRNSEVVLRIKEKVGCSDQEAEQLFEEMKQYLSFCAESQVRTSPTKKIDIAWHEFILFTKDYAKFCRSHFGHFIHHVPTPRLSGSEKAEDCEDCSPLSNCEPSQVGDQ